ncbi:tetratricopeptide repeat protein [Campylobacter sp. FMV-PI01]|uniref:Tetratricopeptide repeat protein n=2 Tax=Campylobacter portucalensis TaxID=2608384 RepID=A0A6L5WIJ0_9BACT|nr:tetratricopeptide repeat protein [Campylobacter portucalensis]
MMNDLLTKALIYESQGLNNDALKIYNEILKIQPENIEILKAVERIKYKPNQEMLNLFFSKNKDDIDKFKRWLTQI